MSKISIKNLSVGYKKPIVQNIDIDIKNSETIAILGKNGSGKSTFLGGLCGINKVFSGNILIDDINIHNLSARKRARYISYYTQRTPVMDGLLAEQVIEMGCYSRFNEVFAFKTQNEKQSIVSKCADMLGITHLLKSECHKLSEGQRSLVFLAKLFAQDTPLVLLDEPDNNLDYENTNMIFSLSNKLIKNQNKSAITVLHNPSLALNYCDRIIILDNGTTTSDFSVNETRLEDIQKNLRFIYPNINIGKDVKTDKFYTIYEEN